MIGVGCRGSTKGKIRVMERFSGSEQEAAEQLAKSLAQHNKGEYFVFLIDGNKYRILKRFKRSFGVQIRIPTPLHPFRFPSIGFGVKGR